ncbi:MAG: hypothetical protein AB1349_05520 [Elusimicrobiota bacterium]
MVDATVFPANVTYPTDTGLLEKVRVWLVEKIKAAFVPLGRKGLVTRKIEKWVKWKQKSRSKIEGFIGVVKVHRGLERLLFKNEELNIRLGFLAMNLSTALARI